MSAVRLPTADKLAAIIREEDGDHSLGAGALAERIVARLTAAPRTVDPSIFPTCPLDGQLILGDAIHAEHSPDYKPNYKKER